MIRLGCLPPIISISLILAGGQSIYTYVKNRKVTTITIEEAIKKPVSSAWLRIEGGQFDTFNAVYSPSSKDGDATSICVPLQPIDASLNDGKIHVLVMTRDPGLVELINDTRKAGESPSPQSAMGDVLIEHADKIMLRRPVEGLVKVDGESDKKELARLKKTYGNLSRYVILLEEGKRPGFGNGVFLITLGLVIGGCYIWWARSDDTALGSGLPPPLPQPPNMPPPLP